VRVRVERLGNGEGDYGLRRKINWEVLCFVKSYCFGDAC